MSVCQVNTLQLLKSERSPVDNPHKLLLLRNFYIFKKKTPFPQGSQKRYVHRGKMGPFLGGPNLRVLLRVLIFGSHLRFTQSLQALALFLVQLLLRLVLWLLILWKA